MKTALITGVLGQDGSYLAEHLLRLGYRVVGGTRRVCPGKDRNVELVYCDLLDESSIRQALRKSWPDEIYNLGGQVYVPLSWEMPEHTFDVNVGGLARLLKIVTEVKDDTRVYQASSSEMYGNWAGACTDRTPMAPTSPYGVAKYAAHRLAGIYRGNGLYVVSGILFNHESPRRGPEMVTRKIAMTVANWANGSDEMLMLGHLDSQRDWGFAGDYVKAMHLMLQQDEADDCVVGTGVSYSVLNFLREACNVVGIDEDFMSARIKLDPRMLRVQEIYDMKADTRKARETLGWQPTVDFRGLVKMMVEAELAAVKGAVGV